MNDPLANLNSVPSFELTVAGLNGDNLALNNYSKIFGVDGGQDESPALQWHGAPTNTKSYVVMMYDPDAPTFSGYWHWTVKNVPASATGLSADAGNLNENKLPAGASHVRGDSGFDGYIGAAPPAGEKHRYYLIVSALDVEKLDVPDDATPATVAFTMKDHVVARAVKITYAQS